MNDAWIIIILGLWIYPILGYFVIRMTKNKPLAKKIIFLIISIVFGVTLIGLLTNISTTLDELDWWFISSIYLSISVLLWWCAFRKNKVLKGFGIVLMVIIFGFGYLSGTIGALGVGFVVGEYECDYRVNLGNGIIYKEFALGNAISDYRGKRVEVFKSLPWFPLIEWRIKKMDYHNVLPYLRRLYVTFKPEEKKIFLWTIDKRWKKEKLEYWSASLDLK